MKILVAACDTNFFQSCLTLVASISRGSPTPEVDSIHIYDLGLKQKEIDTLQSLNKVHLEVRNFPFCGHLWKHYLQAPGCAWKIYLLWLYSNFPKDTLVLYLDCGICAMGNIREIYDIIDRDEIFLVEDRDQYNISWTTKLMIERMKVTITELLSKQLCCGIMGFKSRGKYQSLFSDAFFLSLDEEMFSNSLSWPKLKNKYYYFGKTRITIPILDIDTETWFGTRWDQSIYSILRLRYKIPGHDLTRYGEYRPEKKSECLLYVHRGSYVDISGLSS